jgi:Xaa-Pro aminopeptidase
VSTKASIPGESYARRLAGATAASATAGLQALLIGVGADLRYLTGYEALATERLTLLVVPAASRAGAAGPAAHGEPTLIVPRLEAAPALACAAASSGGVLVETWEETQDPLQLVAERLEEARGPGADRAGAVAVSDSLRAAFVLGLQDVLPGARFSLASSVLGELRMHKDADEIELLHAAARAADRVVAAIAAGRLVGRTEADVAREVRDRLVAEGHEEAEFAIVASGPNSASPHHHPGERVIQAGDPIVLDIGGTLSGYGSDTSRTLWVTGGDSAKGPDDEFRHLYAVLQAAQAKATAAVRPGVPCEGIDAVARGLIAEAGYGAAFLHRTGHGIGLEGHEEPYIVDGNARPLEPGMAFSIEPGIYLEGRYGARIEDIVVCGDDGVLVLNEQPRELTVVSG